MTTPAELDHDAGARFLEKLLDAGPETLCVATDEQVDAMMDAAGVEVGTPETVEEMLARVERRRRKRLDPGEEAGAARRGAPKRPAARVAWVAGAVVAAAAAAGVAAEVGRAVGGPLAIGPEPSSSADTPRERAARLREEALAACGAGELGACATKLDDAKRLDPAGESEPRVVAARAAIATAPAPSPVPSVSAPPDGLKPR
ncbi:MAG TPA: hypothetical protein VHS09_11170 [Polyangiaceae bacterium]|jgi:hypothetical protein|nr:hypothetical protein [Polyangiaceae bacterium]